jgi:hypothetical protein
MDDTTGSNKRGRHVGLVIIGALIGILIIVSGSAERFLYWVVAILTALSLLLLFLFVLALVFVLISAILHRYVAMRRRQEEEQANSEPIYRPPPLRYRRNQYNPAQQPSPRPPNSWEDDD